jgi:hypothetical protein
VHKFKSQRDELLTGPPWFEARVRRMSTIAHGICAVSSGRAGRSVTSNRAKHCSQITGQRAAEKQGLSTPSGAPQTRQCRVPVGQPTIRPSGAPTSAGGMCATNDRKDRGAHARQNPAAASFGDGRQTPSAVLQRDCPEFPRRDGPGLKVHRPANRPGTASLPTGGRDPTPTVDARRAPAGEGGGRAFAKTCAALSLVNRSAADRAGSRPCHTVSA